MCLVRAYLQIASYNFLTTYCDTKIFNQETYHIIHQEAHHIIHFLPIREILSFSNFCSTIEKYCHGDNSQIDLSTAN